MKSLSTTVVSKISFAAFFIFSAATARAQSTGSGAGPGDSSAEKAAVVKYLGIQDDMLIFNVSYNNPEGNKFLLAVKDQDGNQLYQDLFRDKMFYKQFKLPKSDKERVVFVIRDGLQKPIVKTFDINIDSHLVQDVAIKKLK
jgi:hypothetical protein